MAPHPASPPPPLKRSYAMARLAPPQGASVGTADIGVGTTASISGPAQAIQTVTAQVVSGVGAVAGTEAGAKSAPSSPGPSESPQQPPSVKEQRLLNKYQAGSCGAAVGGSGDSTKPVGGAAAAATGEMMDYDAPTDDDDEEEGNNSNSGATAGSVAPVAPVATTTKSNKEKEVEGSEPVHVPKSPSKTSLGTAASKHSTSPKHRRNGGSGNSLGASVLKKVVVVVVVVVVAVFAIECVCVFLTFFSGNRPLQPSQSAVWKWTSFWLGLGYTSPRSWVASTRPSSMWPTRMTTKLVLRRVLEFSRA